MLDGAKDVAPASAGISGSRPAIAALFVMSVLAFAAFLFTQYDVTQGTLKLPWTQLQLGEASETFGEGQEDH